MNVRRHRAIRIAASAAVLIAICACGTAPPEEGDDVAPVVTPASGPVTLPDDVMPLTEGGEVAPREPDVSTVTARFGDGDFERLRNRVQTFMDSHGWTLVEGSEVDSERNAANLESMGMTEAAALARRSPSYGASYQQDGQTVAVLLDSLDGTLQMSINWF